MINININTLISGILILGIWSFLYRDNKIYRYVGSIAIGFTVANLSLVTWDYLRLKVLVPISEGELILLAPIIISLLFFFSYSKNSNTRSWYQIPTVILIGTGAGLSIRSSAHFSIIGPTVATIIPIVSKAGLMSSINNIITIISVVAVLFYFFFTKEATGTLGVLNKIGRYVIMAGFGSEMANLALARCPIIIERVEFLFFKTSLWILVFPFLALIVIDVILRSRKK